MKTHLVLVTAAMLVVGGCGRGVPPAAEPEKTASQSSQSSAEDRAQALCEQHGLPAARQHDEASELVAAHPSSAASFARWETTRHGEDGPRPSPRPRATDGSDFLALCYFEGDFPFPGPPPPPEAGANWEAPDWNVLGLTVSEDGRSTLYSVSPHDRVDVQSDAPAYDGAG